jgi:exopolysaccharide production protein ExoZ
MIKNIQYLRAFAALNVVYFHTLLASEMYDIQTIIFSKIGNWGASGVDIFFVISGFIMMHVQLNNPKKMLMFFLSRLNRIVPIYWLLSILILLVYLAFPEIFRNFTLNFKWVFSSFFFVSQLITGDFPIIAIGWTLEWEMLFYLTFGLSIYFKKIKTRVLFIFFLMVLIFLISKKLFIFEFFLGILVALIYNRFRISKQIGFLLLITGITLLFLSINPISSIKNYDRFFYWGIPSAILITGAVYSKQLENSFLMYLGNASYSIYLLQILTVPCFYKIVTYSHLKINSEFLTIICFVLTIICSCIFHSVIEKRLQIKKDQK